MGEWEIAEVLIGIFCVCVAAFIIYLLYVCYLKNCRSYRYENGVPNVAILRQSRFGSAGMKHFSAASFRSSHFNGDQQKIAKSESNSKRPHTFPLSPASRAHGHDIPEIRVDPA